MMRRYFDLFPEKTARTLLILALLCCARPAASDEVQVAVAANFTGPMQKLVTLFERKTGHKALLSFGSVGKFYAQIISAAPFEILISADEETPLRLEKEHLTLPGSRFTYAVGKLVLWSPHADLIDPQGKVLERGDFAHLAVSHPKLTVYGAAARDVLQRLGVFEKLAPRLIQGETITQAYQFVVTGNAELGFVALSQVWQNGSIREGSAWIVPDSLVAPLRQDAVILEKGSYNPAALALMTYLRSDEAGEIIRSFGYAIP
jgi:molybdate transport system substrate-binding protein